MNETTRTIAGTALHPVGLGCMNLSWALRHAADL
jgi:hypothetical protein